MYSDSPKKARDGQNSKKKYPWTFKRAAALIGIVILAGMYVVTLIAAIVDAPGSGRLFRTSLGLTIAIPIILWILIWCVGKFRMKGSIADFHILEDAAESSVTEGSDSLRSRRDEKGKS